MVRSLIASLVAAILLVACDSSHPVRITNEAGQPVILYEDARSPQVQRHLEPGAEVVLNWLIDPSASDAVRLREVRATSLDGALLFCKRLTYGELRQSGWAVTVRRGQVECQL